MIELNSPLKMKIKMPRLEDDQQALASLNAGWRLEINLLGRRMLRRPLPSHLVMTQLTYKKKMLEHVEYYNHTKERTVE